MVPVAPLWWQQRLSFWSTRFSLKTPCLIGGVEKKQDCCFPTDVWTTICELAPRHFRMDQNCTSGYPIRGKQRKAVYAALKHPATGRQILESTRNMAPSMTYQDLRHILRDFQKNGVAICLNPECQTGRFYALATFEENLSQTSQQLSLCAKISRAKTRMAVLKEVAKERFFESHPLTATQVKKHMRESYPLGLNHVLAALKYLEEHSLVEIAGHTDKRELKIYTITDVGKSILSQLQQPKRQVHHD